MRGAHPFEGTSGSRQATSLSAPAFAGNNICWFDHVSADGNRVVLHFSPNASLRLWGQGSSYEVDKGKIRRSNTNGAGTDSVVDVSLAPGETMTGMATVEDMCTYAVLERDGKPGLLIKASNNALGQHSEGSRQSLIRDVVSLVRECAEAKGGWQWFNAPRLLVQLGR